MEFNNMIAQFSQRVKSLKDSISSEEATKTALVMPFFQMLGYDIFNPTEFVPEFTADVAGIKKGEKVDFAIMINGKPVVVVECKSCTTDIGKHSGQLSRYFHVTEAKFGILTNGVVYQFFTDLDKTNVMDGTPFLEFDILNIKENLIPEMEKFCKKDLNVDNILTAAQELKYTQLIKNWLQKQTHEVGEDFIKLVIGVIHDGQQIVRTQKMIDTFRPIVKHSLTQFLNEYANARFKAAMLSNAEDDGDDAEARETKEAGAAEPEAEAISTTIETTLEELEAYAIVKSLLRDLIDVGRLTYKHTDRYMVILFDNNSRKRICRLWFRGKQKYITTPDKDMNPVRRDISDLNDIYNYSEYIREVCGRYI